LAGRLCLQQDNSGTKCSPIVILSIEWYSLAASVLPYVRCGAQPCLSRPQETQVRESTHFGSSCFAYNSIYISNVLKTVLFVENGVMYVSPADSLTANLSELANKEWAEWTEQTNRVRYLTSRMYEVGEHELFLLAAC
jgi:hypothetical protein